MKENTSRSHKRFTHTAYQQQPKNEVRVFPFILKAKHKTLHDKQAWAELKNSAEKQSARVSIDQV